jgi:hypothetical protein
MVQVHHHVADTMPVQPRDDPAHQRFAADRHRRLGAIVGQRSQACAEAGGQYECV